MAEHGARVQPQPGNDPAVVADSEQLEPATMEVIHHTATSEPGNGPMEAAIDINGEGSRSGSPTRSEAASSCESRIKADFKFLWRLRKYLLLLAVLAVSVTYNAGLSPPGGFQMDNTLHHNAVAGDPLLPVTFFRRYEAFFYCNATAFAASLILIILLLSRGVASVRKRVWLRSMQVTMILDLFSLMGAYAAGSCRAIKSSVFIMVLVCAVFLYVGVHILVFIRVVPKWLKERVRKILYLILEKLRGILNQMLSICHLPPIDGQRNGQNEIYEIEEARKFILMLATFAATITYQAGMSPAGGFWGGNGHGYLPGTFVLRRHNLPRFNFFTCCNATSFVASLVTVILLLSTELSMHGISTGALFVCVLVDMFGLIGAYAAGCSRNVRTSVGVILIIVVVLICVLVLVLVLQSKPATDLIDKELKPAFTKLLSMLSWRRGRHLSNLKQIDSHRTHQQGTVHVSPETEAEGLSNSQHYHADINLVSTGDVKSAAPASDLNTISNALNQPHDRSDQAAMQTVCSSSTDATTEEGPPYNMEVQSGGSQKVAIPMGPSSSSYSGKATHDIPRPQGTVDQSAMEKSSEVRCSLPHNHQDSAEQPAEPMSSHNIGSAIDSMDVGQATQHQEISSDCSDRSPEGILLKKSRTYLLFLAILSVSLTYQAGLSPPGGFWTSNATNHLAGDPILEDNYHKRYLAFFYLNATAFAASLVMILMLLSRKMSNRVIKRRALQTAMITDLLALMGAFIAGSCREKIKTIFISVVILPVVAYVCLHVLVSGLIIAGWKRIEQAQPKSPQTENRLRDDNENEQGPPKSPQTDNKLRADNEKEQASPRSPQIENKSRVDNEKEQALPKPPQTDKKSRDDKEKDLEQRRKLLFVLAILAATVTYQAGLNPPGGVWPDENSRDGKPGNPVLQDSHPKRYNVFYYSNAVSFVSSVAVIILLVNRESCECGIESYALRVCLVAGLLGLLIAYSAGSCRKLKPVIYLAVIAAAVLVCLVIQFLVLSSTQGRLLTWLRTWIRKILPLETDIENSSDEANTDRNAPGSVHQINGKKENKRYKYVMLLAILAASIAYQAGLNPPGGFWPDDTPEGYEAGKPVLKDIHSSRYMVFFVFNSISFMSSIAVVILLLIKSLRTKKVPLQALHFIMILDLLALMTAYAAGSCRKFRTSIFILLVVCCVVVYLMVVIILSSGIARWLTKRKGKVASLLGCRSHLTGMHTLPTEQDV